MERFEAFNSWSRQLVGALLFAFAGLALLATEAGADECVPASKVAIVVDDSTSMGGNDPMRIRAQAIRMLIKKPANRTVELSAVEFGDTAGPLFSPGLPSTDRKRMLAGLKRLRADGFGQNSLTQYKPAFRASNGLHPNAEARIFLTDGENYDGRVSRKLIGGIPTYVIGLGIGRKGFGLKLNRIARVSGGRFYPLKRNHRSTPRQQLARLQPVVNQIAAKLRCAGITKTVQIKAKKKGQRFGPYLVKFGGHGTIQVQATWVRSGTRIRFVNCRVVNRQGRVVADLKGKGRRAKLKIRTSGNRANKLLVVKRPKSGFRLIFNVKVVKVKRPTSVVVQIEQGGGGNAFKPDGGDKPPGPTPERRVPITVDNRVTNGMSMREDPTPARLTTQKWTFCTSRNCNINGTERRTGETFDAAVCQAWGERTTNGNDHSAVDDANPARFESTRYYGVRLTDGTFGYISEVWVAAQHRGGLWLPLCR